MSDTVGTVLLTREQIEERAREIGEEIARDYEGEEVYLIGTLRGAVVWMADMMKNIKNKLAALMMRSDLNAMKKEFDYEEYGGAPILGINGPVIKIHGSSNSVAVKNAIIKSIPYSREKVVDIIKRSMLDLEEIIEKDEEE